MVYIRFIIIYFIILPTIIIRLIIYFPPPFYNVHHIVYDLCSMRARKWAYVIKLVCYFFLYYVFIIRLCFFCVCVLLITYGQKGDTRIITLYLYVYTRGKKKNLLVSFRSRSLNARGRGCAAPMEFGCIHQISVSDSIVISGISSRVFGEREGARKTKEMAEKEKKTHRDDKMRVRTTPRPDCTCHLPTRRIPLYGFL